MSTLSEQTKARGRSRPDHALTMANGPPLPPGFEKSEGKHPMFFKSWKFANPLPPNAPVHMMTGVHTFDPEYLKFLTMAVDLSMEHMKPNLDEDGFVGQGHIHKVTSGFGTVSGLGQDPMGYPLRGNASLRDEQGVPNDWRRPDDREIYMEWLDLFFSTWMDRPIKQTKKSKSGPPHMIYELIDKKKLVEDRLAEPVFLKIMKKIKDRKYRDLRKDHQCIGCGVVGRRGQSDAADVVRMVAPFEYAVSGGMKGERVRASKSVNIDGVAYPKLSAMRMRTIVGYSTILNSIGQIFSTGHLYSAYERFPLVLKFADLQDKVDELCANFLPEEPVLDAFAGDVGNFDGAAIPDFRWNCITESAENYWDGGFVELQDMLHKAPWCAPPLGAGLKFEWSGNPDDPAAYDGSGSLKSGHNMVTIIGIIEMVGEFLTNCHYAFGNVKGHVKEILEGKYLLRLWDKGDDHVIWGAPAAVARYAEVATAVDDKGRTKYAYFKVEPEPGKQFIGNIMQRLGPRKFLCVPRIHSLHDKSFCNEHGIGDFDHRGIFRPSPFRPCWPIGAFVRKILYGASNALGIYTELRDKAWQDSGALARYGSINAILDAAMDKQGAVFRLAKSAMDVDVIIDSAKLDYRYHDDEISPEIVSMFKSSLDQKLTTGWAERCFGGHII